ncbi:translation initiation factor 2 [Lachnospiraceae bacterium KM106-2]|nr:translation initiation factor 2 [Lachnospiraceae bacterium KM106-2]
MKKGLGVSMAKMKIYELAKQLDQSSKAIVSYLNENGIAVKSHMSNVEDEAIALVNKKFGAKNNAPKKETKQEDRTKQETNKPASRPENRILENKNNNNQNQNRNQNRNNNGPSNNQNRNNGGQGNNQNRSNGQGNNQNRNNGGQGNNQNRSNGGQGNNQNRSYNGQGNNQNRSNGGQGNNQNRSNGGQGNNQNRSNNGGQGNNQNRSNNGQGNNQNRSNNGGQGNNGNRNGGGGRPGFNNRNNNNNRPYNKNNNRNNRNNKQNDAPKKDPNRKGAFIKPEPVKVVEEEIKSITIPETVTLKELGDKMRIPSAQLVKKFFMQGKMYTLNSEITFEEAEELALEYDIIAELEEKVDVIEELLKEEEEDPKDMVKRPPVVCVMGHVDHGKTSLLDAIRHSDVTDREAGGITQHIGASVVKAGDGTITFLDTPGHEAFTSMRMRGAQSTDIAILVVAADDGVMPQTIEAINHAKAAGVEIIVAINKIDKPSANIERVKQELVEYELVAEDWGGSTIFVPVSAHTHEGIDTLLEMISLTAEMLELKANPNRKARGIVIEAQLDKGRGPVATVLVQKGTLHVGDPIVIGSAYGKVRAMMDDKGRRVTEAGPSKPVEILGLNEVPGAGDIFMCEENEKEARAIAEAFIKESREKLLDDTKSKLSLDGLFSQIQAGNIKELNLIVKADVQGSVEAVKQSLLKLSNEEVAIRIIHGGVGAINESDVTLASASNAIIIGFNVKPDNMAREMVDREKVDLRLYRVIYNAIEDIEAAMKGMLDPIFEEKVTGHAEVRQTFKASGVGVIAGSYILDGKISRGSKARVTRDGELIFEGNLASLKRFKDDVKEVNAGYECGLVFEKYNDLREGDLVESYIMVEVPR